MRKILVRLVIAGVVPAIAAAQDTLAAKAREMVVGGFIISGQHNSSFNSVARKATGNVKGLELLARTGRFGIDIHSSSSAFSNPPDVVDAHVDALIQVRQMTASLGMGRRAVTSALGTSGFTFARLGAQKGIDIGATGLHARLAGWIYLPTDNQIMAVSGAAESSIVFSPASLPIFVQFGYHNEIFKATASSGATPEEIRGLQLGAGVRFGGT